jgi:hypothetical protein
VRNRTAQSNALNPSLNKIEGWKKKEVTTGTGLTVTVAVAQVIVIRAADGIQ